MRTLISDPKRLREFIDREARKAGFDLVGVTRPDAIPLAPERLKRFVAQGFHGSMGWMEETMARRADPSTLWPEVRSGIMLAMDYGPDCGPPALPDETGSGALPVYARNREERAVVARATK